MEACIRFASNQFRKPPAYLLQSPSNQATLAGGEKCLRGNIKANLRNHFKQLEGNPRISQTARSLIPIPQLVLPSG